MRLTREVMLERFRARDPVYETRFVVGVVTTGIYCVPTCPARKPRAENVRFFDAVDEARRFGLRPCKRCKPDQVHAGRDPEREELERLVARVRANPGEFPNAASLPRAAGVGPTKLAELFREHYHATPRELLCDARVARACTELLTTRRRALSIALDVGFESLSAFHSNFRRKTGMSPGDYRRMGAAGTFVLRLPRGFPVDHVLRAIGRDPDGRTERVDGRRLLRAVRLGGKPALLRVELRGGDLRCVVEARRALGPAEMGAAHATLLRLLGLTVEPAAFEKRARSEPGVRRLIRGRAGLRIPQTPNPYEGLVWAIVGQQVNLAFAFACRNRLIDLAGARAGDGLRAHPTPRDVAKLDYADLTKLQYSRRKAEYLIDTSRTIAEGELDLDAVANGSATSAEAALLAVRGLGPWSAHYVLMRACGFADCVPVGDAGLVRALERFHGLDHRPGAEETVALMKPFAPHRSLATFHLWKTLGEPA